MKEIALEDIATVFATEFVKQTTIKEFRNNRCEKHRIMLDDFLRMNFSRRRKIVEKVLDKILKDEK